MTAKNINANEAGMIRVGWFSVNRLGFGAMRITGDGVWGEPKDRHNAISLLRRAVDMGINFIDTADSYGPEVSEKLIKEALFPYSGLLIATKGGFVRRGPGIWQADCSPKHLREACEASLKRLKLDTIDLYQLHTVDPNIPFEDSFATLLELQREGKIRHIGLSNIEPHHFASAINMGHFVSVQNNYNIFNREHEDVLRLCEQHGQVFIPYFPLGGNSFRGSDNSVLAEIAQHHNVSVYQIALAWLLDHSTSILPIPGTSSLPHLEDNIASGMIGLEDIEVKQLNKIADNVT